ncbi:MAG TPA: metal-dependent hydrolase [Hyphomicrobiaceae bacterium]|nr:metal-dependent hydrolase [Hyphomicrobiaceae bacterium]
MANFTTHIAAGTLVSGTLATLTVAANVISPESLVAVTLAGVFGSVLPDIDLRDSRPSRAFFSCLAIFLSFCVLFAVAHRFSIVEMWIAWLGTLLAVRYGLQLIFLRFSAHRGIWHSVVAGLFFWFLTAIIFHRGFGYHEGVAWLAGGFLFIGYITHLVLDELYSVDVFDTRIKASFGSALKLYDGKHLGDSAVVALACVLAFALSPPARPFIDGITSPRLWVGLQHRLLPRDRWFGVFGEPSRAEGPASDIVTGSVILPARAPAGEPASAPADSSRPQQ